MAKVDRRRPGRHVDDARGDRRPAGRPGGARHLAGDQPRRRHQRPAAVPRGGASRPARPPPSAAAGCSPPSSRRSEAADDAGTPPTHRHADLRSAPPRAWRRRRPRPRHRAELDEVLAPRPRPARPRRAARPRRPVRRDAGVRHRRAARRARRRTQPDEPRGGHPGGSRPHGIPRGARRPSRSSSSATTRGTTPTSSPATPPQWWSAPGGRAPVLPHPLPTPVLAFAIRHLGADAGVMVTAATTRRRTTATRSTSATAARSCRRPTPRSPRRSPASDRSPTCRCADDGWETLGDDVLEAYVDAAAAVVAPDSPRDLTVVHTALHGVGHDTVLRRLRPGRLPRPDRRCRARPSPTQTSPRSPSPTPRSRARSTPPSSSPAQVRPDLVIANDPDADRCAVAVADDGRGGWRMLRGDEVGALLGAHILARGRRRGRASSRTRSSPRGCSRRWRPRQASATRRPSPGFKWIARVAGPALRLRGGARLLRRPGHGARQGRRQRRAALAELAAGLKAQGRTLVDLLDDLAVEHGVHATDSFSVRVADLALIGHGHGAAARSSRPRPSRRSPSHAPTTSPPATAGCRRPRACATTSRTARA